MVVVMMKQSASVIDKHNLEKYVDHFVIPKVYNWRRHVVFKRGPKWFLEKKIVIHKPE